MFGDGGVSVSNRWHDEICISFQSPLTWCNINPEIRYPLAATVITFGRYAEESASHVWSEQANALLSNAPNPETVLTAFIARFRPMIWNGSRAALIEANARLLDSIAPMFPSLKPLAEATKARLAEEIATERRHETERDRIEDERFE